MGALILVDSCVLVDLARAFTRGPERMRELLSLLEGSEHVTSAVVMGELLYGVELMPSAARRAQQRLFCEVAFARLPVLGIDAQVAAEWATLAADLRGRGHTIKQHDLWIAATALRHNAAVLTDNLRDFAPIEGLQIRRWEGIPG